MHRALFVVALLLPFSMLAPSGETQAVPRYAVPQAAAGFTLEPLVAAPGATALAFGPGVNGDDLYLTTLTGDVLRVPLVWTAAGPAANGVTTFASGFSQPLGIEFDGAVAFVADSHANPDTGRTDGRITRIGDDGTHDVIVDGLPNGRHNTNHLRIGPDARLYIANGNPNDNGQDGGDADVFPYSGAVLSIDPDDVTPASPAILEWTDGGSPIAAADIAGHAANADFASQVSVLAHGFRNIFGLAFGPDGTAYTAMNGADVPPSQDALFRITPGADYGFPFCYNEGLAGATGDGISVVANPTFSGHDCTATPPATALLGWHTCTTGLDVPNTGPFGFPASMRSSVFVAECAAFFPDDLAAQLAEDPSTHSLSHKVTRVELGPDGHATHVRDFVTGLAAPTDVRFGPDGAMYIADVEMVYRVSPLGAVDTGAHVPRLADLTPIVPAPVLPIPDAPGVTIFATAFQFAPPIVAVPAGTTIEWQGALLGHTVTTASSLIDAVSGIPNDESNSDADADTFNAPLPQGGSFTHTFSTPGVYYYFCEPHVGLGMVGTVVVL